MCRRFVAVLSVLFLSSAATGQRADHEPMLLRASNVSKAAVEPLVPLCARAAGIEVQAEYANNPAVAKDIIDGARFDVVVVETHMLDDLATRNLVARSSIRPLAALRMGLATREPPPYPRIDTEAAFKRAVAERGCRCVRRCIAQGRARGREIYRVSAVAGGSRAVQRKRLPAGSVAKADDDGGDVDEEVFPRMGVFVGWVDVEHGEPLAIGDSRVMVRRPVLEKHWAHPKAHQKICAASDTFSRSQFPNKREQGDNRPKRFRAK